MFLRHFRDGRLLVPIALLIVTTIYFLDALFMAPPMRNGDMTVSFFPMAIALVMYLAIGAVIGHLVRTSEAVQESDSTTGQKHGLGPLWVTLVTAAYILAFSTLGYFLSTAVYVFVLTLLFGEGIKGIPFKLIASCVITLAGYLLFEVVFQVRLPTLWSL